MRINLAICDFDCTITKYDVLDMLCSHVGAYEISCSINEDYINGRIDGKTALIKRFGLLEGAKLSRLSELLKEVEISEYAELFFKICREKGIYTIVESGNLDFVLEYFQHRLGYNMFSCSHLPIIDGLLGSSTDYRCRFVQKAKYSNEYMKKRRIEKSNVIAIGDSFSDEPLFNIAEQGFLIGEKKIKLSSVVNVDSFLDIIKFIENN